MNSDYFDKLKQNAQQKKEFRESLSYSTEYIDWLEGFTSEHGSFSTDSFMYGGEFLTEQDKINIHNVQFLFEEIQDYFDVNYLDFTRTDYGKFYSIQHNGVGYFIGVDIGQGASFYCTRLESPEEDSLEFKHIMSGVKLPKTVYDEYQLEELTSLIEKLSSAGVSINAITDTTEKAIKKVKTKTSSNNS